MSTFLSSLTSTQKQAVSYIRSALAQGLTATAGVKQYRAGGGHIANASWYGMYRDLYGMEGKTRTIAQTPETYLIRDTMFEKLDWDFREKYIMQMKVHGYSEELEQNITAWVTVESDKMLTKGEWRIGAQQAVTDTLGSIPMIISRISEWQAFERARD